MFLSHIDVYLSKTKQNTQNSNKNKYILEWGFKNKKKKHSL